MKRSLCSLGAAPSPTELQPYLGFGILRGGTVPTDYQHNMD